LKQSFGFTGEPAEVFTYSEYVARSINSRTLIGKVLYCGQNGYDDIPKISDDPYCIDDSLYSDEIFSDDSEEMSDLDSYEDLTDVYSYDENF
jgi:hypothetical protein